MVGVAVVVGVVVVVGVGVVVVVGVAVGVAVMELDDRQQVVHGSRLIAEALAIFRQELLKAGIPLRNQ